VVEESEDHSVEVPGKVKKKKKSPAKKLAKLKDNDDAEEEDLDRKSIFPIPHTGQDVEEIEKTKASRTSWSIARHRLEGSKLLHQFGW
jgi:hypothetical protein